MNLCANIGAELQDIQVEAVIFRENVYVQKKTWKNISVIQMKKVLEIKHSTPCVLDGVSLKASNLVENGEEQTVIYSNFEFVANYEFSSAKSMRIRTKWSRT